MLMEEDADVVEKEARLHTSADGGERKDLWDWIARDAVDRVLVSLSSREAQ